MVPLLLFERTNGASNLLLLLLSWMLLLLFAIVVPSPSCSLFVHACTLIVVGKNATVDGTTLIAHTDDAGTSAADLRLIRVPAQQHPMGSKRPIYRFKQGNPRVVTYDRGPQYKPKHDEQIPSVPLGYIDQVEYTYAYFDQDYGMMNEVQLSIGESTCGARTAGWPADLEYGYNLFGIAELSKVAMERCDSARCAIQTMGDLAVEYGFYSEDSADPKNPGYDASSEAVGIADRYGEAWIFHVVTGRNNASAVWAAQRVPDDHVTVVANAFMIRQLDLNDPDNYMASPNVTAFAEEMGWWNPHVDGPFDFYAAYGYMIPTPRYALYSGRRIWRVFDLVAPTLQLDSTIGMHPSVPTYPFSVQAETKLDTRGLMSILMDHYEDTPYDQTKGIAAGAWGVPVRFDNFDGPSANIHGSWERTISMFRTMFSFVLEARSDLDDDIGGVVWYGQSSPHGTVYVPFSCSQKNVPQSFLIGRESHFSTDSAWWAFDFVNNWSYLRYSIISKDVKAEQKRLQDEAFEHVTRVRKTITQRGMFVNRTAYLEEQNNHFASYVVREWWKLAWRLVSTFSDGFILTGEGPHDLLNPGYPPWFLEAVGYTTWPGDTYNPPTQAIDAQPYLDAMFSKDVDVVEERQSSLHVPSFLCGLLSAVLAAILVMVGYSSRIYHLNHKKRSSYRLVPSSHEKPLD